MIRTLAHQTGAYKFFDFNGKEKTMEGVHWFEELSLYAEVLLQLTCKRAMMFRFRVGACPQAQLLKTSFGACLYLRHRTTLTALTFAGHMLSHGRGGTRQASEVLCMSVFIICPSSCSVITPASIFISLFLSLSLSLSPSLFPRFSRPLILLRLLQATLTELFTLAGNDLADCIRKSPGPVGPRAVASVFD